MRVFLLLIALAMAASAQWVKQDSGSTASLRGISAVSETLAWASGTLGTVLRTTNGGNSWQTLKVPGAEALDFRAIRAFDDKTAFIMSVGSGESSRIYKTIDGGAHWELVLRNQDPQGFFDAIQFWNAQRGIVIGDPVGGHIFAATTADGGHTWGPVDAASIPPARPGEGAFAASGTCLVVGPGGLAWIGTGGPGGARTYRSNDWGRTWKFADTPIRHDSDASGIFSLAFRDSRHGVAVGGNYSKPGEDTANIAATDDGGVTWNAPALRPKGYRSAVAYIPGTNELVATGTTGIDVSKDGGKSWTHSSDDAYNAMSFAGPTAGWAVGPKGASARYSR
jgi:photosystem II stability/assembly factor-like uncharacterized protein